MVSKWWMVGQSGGKARQSKIYAESNDTIFSGFRRDLTSMQTLAIYRRWSGILSTMVRDRFFRV
jgi:hypothetical protein